MNKAVISKLSYHNLNQDMNQDIPVTTLNIKNVTYVLCYLPPIWNLRAILEPLEQCLIKSSPSRLGGISTTKTYNLVQLDLYSHDIGVPYIVPELKNTVGSV